jgi:hypothetical protein
VGRQPPGNGERLRPSSAQEFGGVGPVLEVHHNRFPRSRGGPGVLSRYTRIKLCCRDKETYRYGTWHGIHRHHLPERRAEEIEITTMKPLFGLISGLHAVTVHRTSSNPNPILHGLLSAKHPQIANPHPNATSPHFTVAIVR